MRDIATKVDASSSLTASEFNSFIAELENLVTRGGITLDSAAGPDTNLLMIAEAVLRHAQAGVSYQDGGAANTFVLTAVQGFEQPSAYFDGMIVSFKAAATNNGACTANVEGIGAVAATKAGGVDYGSAEVVAGNIVTMRYFAGDNRFEEVANTTPEPVGAAAPDQVAVYSDAGGASAFSLTIETGYNQPSAFTDQMVVLFKAATTNAGGGTHSCAISGLGTRDVVEKDGSNPAAARFTADDWVMLVFREVRDAFEIAFVTEQPKADTIFSGVTAASSGSFYAVTSLTESRAPTAYFDGMTVIFRAPVTSSGSVDIEVDQLGQRDLRRLNGANFAADEIPFGAMIIAQFEAANDRFRAAVIPADPPDPLSVDRSARLVNPALTTVSPNETELRVTFTETPVFDGPGFYSAAEDTFVVPSGQGIERVDVAFDLQGTFGAAADGTDAVLARVKVNGATVASDTLIVSSGAEHANAAAFDVPVNDGDVIEATVRRDGTRAYIIASETSFTVRISKVAA